MTLMLQGSHGLFEGHILLSGGSVSEEQFMTLMFQGSHGLYEGHILLSGGSVRF